MNIITFESIKEFANANGRDVEIVEVAKNNEILNGLSLKRTDDDIALSIIYDWQNFDSLEELYAALNKKPDFNVPVELDNFDKSKLIPCVMAISGNEKVLEGIPYKEFLDMAVYLRYVLEKSADATGSFKVTQTVIDGLEYSFDELLEYAINNCEYNFSPFALMPVLQYSFFTNGASIICNLKALEEFYDENGTFVILPSSIHEIIPLPMSYEEALENAERFKEMVIEVNTTVVSPEDRLTDSVYFFDGVEVKQLA